MTCELQHCVCVFMSCLHVLMLCLQMPIICQLFRFINFPDQPIVWREISVITNALRSDSQDKHAQFLRGKWSYLHTCVNAHHNNSAV